MRRFAASFLPLVAAAAIALPALSFGQVKNNDFTRSNMSFDRKYHTDRSRMDGQKSRFQDQSFEMKTYDRTGPYRDAQKRAWLSERDNAGYMSGERYRGNGKSFDRIPDYKPKRETWYQAENPLGIKNSDKNLTKEYKGRLDASKKYMEEYQDYLKENYAEMVGRSMQDINKYNFRSSHSLDPGIPTSVAGEQLHEPDEGGVLDFLLNPGRKRIERPPVSLNGPRRADGIKPEGAVIHKRDLDLLDISPINQPANPQAAQPQRPAENPGRNAAVQAPSAPSGTAPAPRSPAPERRAASPAPNKTGKPAQFDFMKVPEDLKIGDPVIKVEVKDGGY